MTEGLITLENSLGFLRRYHMSAWIAVIAAAGALIWSAYEVLRVILNAQLEGLEIFGPHGPSYHNEVGSLITVRLYPSLLCLFLGWLVLAVAVSRKNLRLAAAALVLLLAIPQSFLASSAENRFESLISEPYQPLVRTAETFPGSSEWTRINASGDIRLYLPEARVRWEMEESPEQMCAQLTAAMDHWADSIKRFYSSGPDSCLWDATKGTDDVDVRVSDYGGQTSVSVEVRATVPVRLDDFR